MNPIGRKTLAPAAWFNAPAARAAVQERACLNAMADVMSTVLCSNEGGRHAILLRYAAALHTTNDSPSFTHELMLALREKSYGDALEYHLRQRSIALHSFTLAGAADAAGDVEAVAWRVGAHGFARAPSSNAMVVCIGADDRILLHGRVSLHPDKPAEYRLVITTKLVMMIDDASRASVAGVLNPSSAAAINSASLERPLDLLLRKSPPKIVHIFGVASLTVCINLTLLTSLLFPLIRRTVLYLSYFPFFTSRTCTCFTSLAYLDGDAGVGNRKSAIEFAVRTRNLASRSCR